jgi:hypothetical protein
MTKPPSPVAPGRHAPRDQGSVFVESIIAAAIVAMALGATLQLVADGANRDRGIEQRRAALLIAQSELAATGSQIPFLPGQTDGLAGNMVWRIEVSPYSDGVDSAAGVLWRVAVSVRARSGGADLAHLETLRLGPQAE